jgi:hypothetical protein
LSYYKTNTSNYLFVFAVAKHGKKNKKEMYRNSPEHESSDTDTADLDDDDVNLDEEFSPKRQNVSNVSHGSRNESQNNDLSFNRQSCNVTDDTDEDPDDSKFSPPCSPNVKIVVSYSSPSVLNHSSPHFYKRCKPGQHKESLHHSHVDPVPDGGNQTSSFPDYCIYCVLALVLLAFIYFMYVKKVDESSPSLQTESTASLNLEHLDKKFDELREKYPNQTERHWKIIKVQLKKLFRPGRQTQPAIILFVAMPHAVEAMNCIAKEIGNTFAEMSNSKSPVLIRGAELAVMEDKLAKLELDNKLLNGFQGGRRVVIMFELESFHGEPLLLLHSYCDHENAAFKDVVIILTLRLDTNESDANINDEFVDDYLGKLWQGKVGVDEMGALRSRIANNKAISWAETDDVLNRNCS